MFRCMMAGLLLLAATLGTISSAVGEDNVFLTANPEPSYDLPDLSVFATADPPEIADVNYDLFSTAISGDDFDTMYASFEKVAGLFSIDDSVSLASKATLKSGLDDSFNTGCGAGGCSVFGRSVLVRSTEVTRTVVRGTGSVVRGTAGAVRGTVVRAGSAAVRILGVQRRQERREARGGLFGGRFRRGC